MIRDITILGIDPGTNLLGFGIIRVRDSKPVFVDCGYLDLRKEKDPYTKLAQIRDYVSKLCEVYHPQHLAIESPFMGKNAQVIFKLGRAQGVALEAARAAGLEITEYAPRKAKIAICGNGAASKDQVGVMVQKTLGINLDMKYADSTDALAIAMCHYYQLVSPLTAAGKQTTWKDFVKANPDRVK